jgi:hypothetical protein
MMNRESRIGPPQNRTGFGGWLALAREQAGLTQLQLHNELVDMIERAHDILRDMSRGEDKTESYLAELRAHRYAYWLKRDGAPRGPRGGDERFSQGYISRLERGGIRCSERTLGALLSFFCDSEAGLLTPAEARLFAKLAGRILNAEELAALFPGRPPGSEGQIRWQRLRSIGISDCEESLHSEAAGGRQVDEPVTATRGFERIAERLILLPVIPPAECAGIKNGVRRWVVAGILETKAVLSHAYEDVIANEWRERSPDPALWVRFEQVKGRVRTYRRNVWKLKLVGVVGVAAMGGLYMLTGTLARLWPFWLFDVVLNAAFVTALACPLLLGWSATMLMIDFHRLRNWGLSPATQI